MRRSLLQAWRSSEQPRSDARRLLSLALHAVRLASSIYMMVLLSLKGDAYVDSLFANVLFSHGTSLYCPARKVKVHMHCQSLVTSLLCDCRL